MSRNNGSPEALQRAIPDVRAAYNYTDAEVETLWEIFHCRPLLAPEFIRTEAQLHRKLGTMDATTVAAVSDDVVRMRNNHSTLQDFASWLFTGEWPQVPSLVPRVIRCLPFPDGCGRMFQASMFPFWPTDGRCGICIQRECHPQVGRAKRDARLIKLHQTLEVGRSKQIDSDFEKFVQVFSRFVQHEGGVDGIAMSWHQWFELNRQDPGKCKSATLGNAYLAMMKIWLELDSRRDRQADFDKMPDEELEDFILQKMVGRLTRKQLALLVQEAEENLGEYLDDGMNDEIYAETKSADR